MSIDDIVELICLGVSEDLSIRFKSMTLNPPVDGNSQIITLLAHDGSEFNIKVTQNEKSKV